MAWCILLMFCIFVYMYVILYTEKILKNKLILYLGRAFIHIIGKRVLLYPFLNQAAVKTPLITEVSPLTVYLERYLAWY